MITQLTVEFSKATAVDTSEEAPIRVLHVDDDAGFLKTAKQILEMQGAFQVDTAQSVEEAWEKMEKEKYDVVICDYQMPGKDGLQFLKELRQKGNKTPFIVFTGRGREEVAIKALNLGADGYFNKVGNPETVYCELAHGIRQSVERKRAEVRAWQEEERLRAIFASSPDAIIVSDLSGKIVDCNEAALKLTGASSKKEIVGKNCLELTAEKDRDRTLKNLERAFQQETTASAEYTLLKEDGEEYPAEVSASSFCDSLKNPVGFAIVIRDITERKQMEKRLIESEERYRSIVENIHDGLAIIEDGKTVYANNRMCEILGYPKSELAKFSGFDFAAPEERERLQRIQADIERTGIRPEELEFWIVRKDGTKRCIQNKYSTIRKDDWSTRIVATTDITERKKAEMHLARALISW